MDRGAIHLVVRIDQVAKEIATTFYTSLAKGDDIGTAYEIAKTGYHSTRGE